MLYYIDRDIRKVNKIIKRSREREKNKILYRQNY